MSWIVNAVIAIGFMGISDVFRKLSSSLKDPLYANLIFQTGSFFTALLLYLMLSRKIEYKPESIVYALLGGIFISSFTLFSYKALANGPGLSVVMPVLRVGGVTIVAILGILLLKEKASLQSIVGLLFSVLGIYLLFSNK